MILNDFEGYSAGLGIFPCAVKRYRMALLVWSSEACTNTSCTDILMRQFTQITEVGEKICLIMTSCWYFGGNWVVDRNKLSLCCQFDDFVTKIKLNT